MGLLFWLPTLVWAAPEKWSEILQFPIFDVYMLKGSGARLRFTPFWPQKYTMLDLRGELVCVQNSGPPWYTCTETKLCTFGCSTAERVCGDSGEVMRLTCEAELIAEENTCGNTAGDPFDTMNGAQMDPFLDLAARERGLAIERRYTTFVLNSAWAEDLKRRQPWPEVFPEYLPLGAGWFWDYGLVAVIDTPIYTPENYFPRLRLVDKDGLIKYFHRTGRGLVWRSVRAEGTFQMESGNQLRLVRANGEQVIFKKRWTSDTKWEQYWMPVEIWRRGEDVRIYIEYAGEGSSDAAKAVRIWTNTGVELRLGWLPTALTTRVTTPRNNVGPTDRVLSLATIEVYQAGRFAHRIRYQYEDIALPNGGAFRVLKEVFVDDQIRCAIAMLPLR